MPQCMDRVKGDGAYIYILLPNQYAFSPHTGVGMRRLRLFRFSLNVKEETADLSSVMVCESKPVEVRDGRPTLPVWKGR